MEENKREWVNHNACRFCKGSRGHSCSGYDCREAAKAAGRYWNKINDKQEAPMKNIDEKVREIRASQAELNHRSELETQASKLISECRYEEAMELLNTLGRFQKRTALAIGRERK